MKYRFLSFLPVVLVRGDWEPPCQYHTCGSDCYFSKGCGNWCGANIFPKCFRPDHDCDRCDKHNDDEAACLDDEFCQACEGSEERKGVKTCMDRFKVWMDRPWLYKTCKVGASPTTKLTEVERWDFCRAQQRTFAECNRQELCHYEKHADDERMFTGYCYPKGYMTQEERICNSIEDMNECLQTPSCYACNVSGINVCYGTEKFKAETDEAKLKCTPSLVGSHEMFLENWKVCSSPPLSGQPACEANSGCQWQKITESSGKCYPVGARDLDKEKTCGQITDADQCLATDSCYSCNIGSAQICTGPLTHSMTPEIHSQCQAGLNYSGKTAEIWRECSAKTYETGCNETPACSYEYNKDKKVGPCYPFGTWNDQEKQCSSIHTEGECSRTEGCYACTINKNFSCKGPAFFAADFINLRNQCTAGKAPTDGLPALIPLEGWEKCKNLNEERCNQASDSCSYEMHSETQGHCYPHGTITPNDLMCNAFTDMAQCKKTPGCYECNINHKRTCWGSVRKANVLTKSQQNSCTGTRLD